MTGKEVVSLKDIKRLPLKDQKQWNVESEKSRISEYHNWRMGLRLGHVQDIDQIEYTVKNGQIIPLAIIELTKAEDTVLYPKAYCKKIDECREHQMNVVRTIGNLLGIPAFYVAYEDGFKQVFVKRLNDNNGTWKEYDSMDKFKTYLQTIHK